MNALVEPHAGDPPPPPTDPGPATLAVMVYGKLCDALITGELRPGEKVSLRTLAERLGTSVMPVREAVSRLVADGALIVSPNRAVAVPVLTLAAFRELTDTRIAIEGLAAERAALCRSESDLDALARHDQAFREECESATPDAGRAMHANRDFHFALYAATGLPTLKAIIARLWLKVGPVLNFDLRSDPPRLVIGGAEAFHARCLAAVAAHDGPAARAAIVGDIENTAAFIASTGRLAA